MRKPCPPSMADRPRDCPESNKVRLDMGRALFDHVSAVYYMTADCYETAKEEPEELLPVLNFLVDLGDLACYTRCGGGLRYMPLPLFTQSRRPASFLFVSCRMDLRPGTPRRQVNCYYGGTIEHHDLVRALVDNLETWQPFML